MNVVGVWIWQENTTHLGTTYHTQVYGFGAATPEQALDDAAAYMKGNPRLHAELHRFCDACKCSGVQLGCKRKPCFTCLGTGRVALGRIR